MVVLGAAARVVFAVACTAEEVPGPPPRLEGVSFAEAGRIETASAATVNAEPSIDLQWLALNPAGASRLVAATRDRPLPHGGGCSYCTSGDSAVVVLEWAGNTLIEVPSYALPWEPVFGTAAIATGDLNGDGLADLVVGTDSQPTHSGGVGQVDVYFDDGAGAFALSTALDAAVTEAVFAGDLDQDGDVDIAVGSDAGSYYGLGLPALSVWQNDGRGALEWTMAITGSADLMAVRGLGDERPLIAVSANRGLAIVRVGDDALEVLLESVPEPTESLWTDCDGDDDLDLIRYQEIWVNNGDEVFVRREAPTAEAGLGGLAADFDLDGDEDYVTRRSSGATIYANDGQCHYAAAITLSRSGPLAIGDRDGDGDTDIVVGGISDIVAYDNLLRSP